MEYHRGKIIEHVGTIPRMAADRYRDRTAITFMGVETTFDDLESKSNQFAHVLTDLGVTPGDRVALYLPNEPRFPIAYFGAIKAGGVPTPLNLRMDTETLSYILEDAGASVMIGSAYLTDDAVQLAETAGIETLVLPGVSDEDQGIVNYSHAMAEAPTEFEMPTREADDVTAQLYTSGTTGQPKGVLLTHRNLLGAIECFRKGGLPLDPDDTVVLVLPLFHIYALNLIFTPMVMIGAETNLQPLPEAEALLSAIDESDATVFPAVPALLTEMYREYRDSPGEYDLSSLEYVGSGASPLADETRRTLQEEWNVPLIEGWAMTETAGAGSVEPHRGVRKEAGCIGRSLPTLEIKLVDPETRETRVGPDQIEPHPDISLDFDDESAVAGEMAIRGACVFAGYHNRPETTRQATDDEGWFYTGDLARMDEDGYFWILDRADDMILSGGNNIYPAAVENALYEHPDVAEAAVVGAPHEVKGQAPVAFVVLEEATAASVDERTLREFTLERVATYAHPRRIFFVEELPRSATEKVRRFKLETRAEKLLDGPLESTEEL